MPRLPKHIEEKVLNYSCNNYDCNRSNYFNKSRVYYDPANRESYLDAFSQLVGDTINELGYTPKEFADKIGVSVRSVNRYINKDSLPEKIETLECVFSLADLETIASNLDELVNYYRLMDIF
jgi:DNA-binding XRE family transcriptional regulator